VGAKVYYTTVNQQRVSDHRKTARAEADAKLDAYVLMCRRLKVSKVQSTFLKQSGTRFHKQEIALSTSILTHILLIVSLSQVSCDKMIIDKNDVAKGLEEFIALQGITKLVMGAAADKHYSKYGLHIPDDCSLFIMLLGLLKLQDIKMIK
jgi:hypothetical protein